MKDSFLHTLHTGSTIHPTAMNTRTWLYSKCKRNVIIPVNQVRKCCNNLACIFKSITFLKAFISSPSSLLSYYPLVFWKIDKKEKPKILYHCGLKVNWYIYLRLAFKGLIMGSLYLLTPSFSFSSLPLLLTPLHLFI